ncbi:MAG: hypothetical protein ACRC2B_06770 [Rubrivivax sp.]
MKSSFKSMAIAVGVASMLVAGGCSTTAPAAERFVAAPAGTVSTYYRRSSGSFGTVDGPVSWTRVDREWQGKPVYAAVSPQAGTTLHDPASNNFGMFAMLNRSGEPVFSFEPPVGYRYPLKVGNEWSSKHTMTTYPGRETRPYDLSYKVEAYEPITVPAGTFQTYRILITDNFGQVDRYWISPETGIPTIKRTQMRPATHPQGAGQLEGELISLTVPK